MGRKKSPYEKSVPRDDTEVRTLTDLVKVIENELGWCPSWDDPRPPWKVRQGEVSKMKAVIKKVERENRHLKGKFTVANLLLAVEYLKRKKEPIKAPAGVVYAVERALENRHEQLEATDVEAELEAAMQEAMEADLPVEERQRWVRRFTRAVGPAREELLAEWRNRER